MLELASLILQYTLALLLFSDFYYHSQDKCPSEDLSTRLALSSRLVASPLNYLFPLSFVIYSSSLAISSFFSSSPLFSELRIGDFVPVLFGVIDEAGDKVDLSFGALYGSRI